jgi:transposase
MSSRSVVGLLQLAEHARAVERDYFGIRDRTQRGRQVTAGAGRWPGGPPPFGYRLVKTIDGATELEIDPGEAACVRTIVELIVDRRLSFTETVAELNARGIPTRSGRKWDRANLTRRLEGAAFTGEAVFRRVDQQWGGHATRLGEDGKPEHGDTVRIKVPPVLDADRVAEFRSVVDGLRRPGRNRNGSYLLSGLITGVCGNHYAGQLRGKDGLRTYQCQGRQQSGGCGCPFFNADEIEAAVRERVNGHLARQPMLTRELRRLTSLELPPPHTRHRRRCQELDELIKQCELAVEAFEHVVGGESAVGELGAQQLVRNLAVLRSVRVEAEAWDESLTRYRAERVEHGLRWRSLVGARADAGVLRPEERRKLYEGLGVEVVLSDAAFRHKEGTVCRTTAWHLESAVPVPADPSDEAWCGVEALLRGRYPAHHFRSGLDLRKALCGMLHRLRTGCHWRDLPAAQFGPYGNLQPRQLRWFKDGVWQEIVALLAEDGVGDLPPSLRQLPPYTVLIKGV